LLAKGVVTTRERRWMAFSFGPTFRPAPGTQDPDPGLLASLAVAGKPGSQDTPSVLFDSDGYPVSIGPDDWGVVSALGLDNYSRLGRILGAGGTLAPPGAGDRALSGSVLNIGPPPPTSVALGSQPVAGIAPPDLADLTPFVAPQLAAQDSAGDQVSDPSAGLSLPPPALSVMGADPVTPAVVADTSSLTGPPTFSADPDPSGRAEFDRGGGGLLARRAQPAPVRQGDLGLFGQGPPATPAFRTLPAIPSLSPLMSLGLSGAQSAPAWAPRIGHPPPPLSYWTAALRDGDRGFSEAKARDDEVAYPSTIQEALRSGLDPLGLNHGLSALALLTEPAGHLVGGLFRPLLPDDPDHPGRRSLRDLIGDSIATLPTLAVGGAEAATDADVATEFPIGPYADLIRQLRGSGQQAHHLNQVAAYGASIPKDDGLAVGLRGNAFSGVGTPHYDFHASLENFWQQYRTGGALSGAKPTNADYDAALRAALQNAGLSQRQASQLAARAAAERAQLPELAPDQDVPRIPGRTGQSRGALR
jgi:hypothetical protein